jgi:tyrosine-protein phosphatase YwqE
LNLILEKTGFSYRKLIELSEQEYIVVNLDIVTPTEESVKKTYFQLKVKGIIRIDVDADAYVLINYCMRQQNDVMTLDYIFFKRKNELVYLGILKKRNNYI